MNAQSKGQPFPAKSRLPIVPTYCRYRTVSDHTMNAIIYATRCAVQPASSTLYCVTCGEPAQVDKQTDYRKGHSGAIVTVTCRNPNCPLHWHTFDASNLNPVNLARYGATVNYDLRSGEKVGK